MEKKGKKNIFNGRILEIEGLPDLKLGDISERIVTTGCMVSLVHPSSLCVLKDVSQKALKGQQVSEYCWRFLISQEVRASL